MGWVGILTSLAASLVYAAFWLLSKAFIQKRKAKRFVGRYEMVNREGTPFTGGTVTIERRSWREDLLSPEPVLTAFAERGAGPAPGTLEWKAVVEAHGFSNAASGNYMYTNRGSGSLRFELSADEKEITEYGTPFNPKSPPFIVVLKRLPHSDHKHR
jgi:hypothetical protein